MSDGVGSVTPTPEPEEEERHPSTLRPEDTDQWRRPPSLSPAPLPSDAFLFPGGSSAREAYVGLRADVNPLHEARTGGSGYSDDPSASAVRERKASAESDEDYMAV